MKHTSLDLMAPLDQPFTLGHWLIEPDLNCLTDLEHLSVKQTIEPRLMHLLCYLAANPERVMTREQLTDELWPSVIVNENSLTRAISELRKKLSVGDISGKQFFQTISKSGYRLIAEVKPYSNIAESHCRNNIHVQSTQDSASILTWLKPEFWQSAFGAASLILAIVISANQFGPTNSPLPDNSANEFITDQVIDPQPQYEGALVSFSGNEDLTMGFPGFDDQNPAISSPLVSEDGSTLAYIRFENNSSTIYLSGVEAVETPMPVFSSENRLFNLSWSPLGNALLFASEPLAIATTLMDKGEPHAKLMMLDLESLRVSILLDPRSGNTDDSADQSINLT